MTARMVRRVLTAAVGAVLLIAAIGSAVTVQAAIQDRAFQAVGCDVGDYTCYYAKLGGSPYSYYCQNSYYSCTSGIPDTPDRRIGQDQQPTNPYCGDAAPAGCANGSVLYTSTTAVDPTGSALANGGTLSGNILVTNNFQNVGTNLPVRSNNP